MTQSDNIIVMSSEMYDAGENRRNSRAPPHVKFVLVSAQFEIAWIFDGKCNCFITLLSSPFINFYAKWKWPCKLIIIFVIL